ncbi:MAG: hypothetical protein EP330_20975, partial [Deltaproteobacteria bacterium]
EASYTDDVNSLNDSEVGGGAEALSFMLNGLVDFGPDDGLQGFVGGGVGVGRVKVGVLTPIAGLDVDDSDSGFAWQILAGVRTPISDKIDIGLKYRFYNQFGNNLVAADGTDAKVGYRSHSLLATLAYNFGEPPAPPPPPPPPPPGLPWPPLLPLAGVYTPEALKLPMAAPALPSVPGLPAPPFEVGALPE